MDTADVKVLEARLDEVLRRIDEIAAYHKEQDAKIGQARGLAVSLNRDLEIRVRDLEQKQSRFMGQIALAAVVAGPALAVVTQHIFR